VLGPLGNGFSVDRSKEAVLVAGGIGIAGVAALAKRLKGRTTVLFGCSSERETVLLNDLTNVPVSVATLDGSVGQKGTVVDLMRHSLSQTGGNDRALYVCGPDGMVRSLMAALQDRPVPCQVLLEERMACGLGLCFGCVTLTKDEEEPYKRVCKEGPVFDLWELSL
jgi:dihydroorotate dehydrogenase electron transfer subunit